MTAPNEERSAQDERNFDVIRLQGPLAYKRAYEIQLERRRQVEEGERRGALYLLEHAPVITLGRNAKDEHVLCDREGLSHLGIEILGTNRGGDVTYHGPGQMVAYPVLNLALWRKSIRWYLRGLEEILIRLLARYELQGERHASYTGVWVEGAKIAAIGVGIHRWVTFHGVALNVQPDMTHFDLIIPCGIGDKPVTSLGELLGTPPDMEQVQQDFEEEFRQYFLHDAVSKEKEATPYA